MIRQAIVGIAATSIRFATPYLYAAAGETLGQLSGVLNIGVEGIMLMGAFGAFFTTLKTGSLVLGLISAVGAGAVLGLIVAFFNVTLRAQQGISGIGVYLFGLGMSAFLFKIAVGGVKTVAGFPDLPIPGLAALPAVGEIFFRQSVLTYGAFALVPVMWFLINRTSFGLEVRAAGQNPQAADSVGVNVVRIRYISSVAGGTLSGVAGASLSIALLNIFQENLTSGMGFIAVALVFFGGWKMWGIAAGALLFSTVNAIQLWIQIQKIPLPSDFTLMMPYVATIVVLALLSRRRVHAPAALGAPFERGTG